MTRSKKVDLGHFVLQEFLDSQALRLILNFDSQIYPDKVTE